MEELLTGLRAAGEPTRLRLLAILAKSELTVTELTQILRQSQPRVSRHLKLMCEAGLLDRFREGSWVFYRRAREGQGARLAALLTGLVPAGDPTVARDMERLEAVRTLRAERAGAFFSANAEQWNRIRSLHVPEAKVEEALLELASVHRTGTLVDLGTGTGRILELIGAGAETGIGIDLSPEMLGLARTHLEQAGVDHCSVRQGDLYDLPLQDETADLVTLHQVLHYLDDPAAAVAEAARVLKPGGRLLIADFAPHELDFLREEQAHRRLGFTEEEVRGWLAQAGLEVKEVRDMPPEGGEEAKLTVVIYAADKHKTGVGRARNATGGQLAGVKA